MKPKTCILLLFSALLTLGATAAHAQFLPGEILVTELAGASVQRYSAAGVLTQTYTGTGTGWEGNSLTPGGNLVTSYGDPNPGGINIFTPSGTQTTFVATGNSFVGDVSVFANGTLALNDQSNNTVQFFSQTGTPLNTVTLTGVSDPFGSTVGSDGMLYVAGLNSNNLARVNTSGVFTLINLSFSPGDLVMNPLDGTLWVSGASNGMVEHVTTSGTLLGGFATGLSGTFAGIALAPDNNSLYVTTFSSTVVRHFDLNGNLLGSFNLTSPNDPLFMTVVPVPEPSTWAMLLSGFTLLGGLHWIRRARKA